jgi:hypothetical protein
MAFQCNRSRLFRLGSAVGVGCAIAACIISITKIAHHKAAWQDWVIVGSCGALIPLVGSAVLAARFMSQIDTHTAANDECFPSSEAEMSYMSWHGYTIYRDFARYRFGVYPSARSTDFVAEYSPRLRRKINRAFTIAAPSTQSIPIENCQDLGILDTQWAELCALKAEKRYLRYLKRGISPQFAYRCAITYASAVTHDSGQA